MTEKNALLTLHESPEAIRKTPKVGTLGWAAIWTWEKLTGPEECPALGRHGVQRLRHQSRNWPQNPLSY